MMNELKLQARIVKDVKTKGGFSFKMANRHQGGIPDLLVKLPLFPIALIECKLNKLKLTGLQRETLSRLHMAGSHAGWLVCQTEGRIYNMFIGADPHASNCIATENCSMISVSGKEWEIGEIIKAIVYWSDREFEYHK